MKKTKLSAKNAITQRLKQSISIIFIMLLTCLSTACQMIDITADKATDKKNNLSTNTHNIESIDNSIIYSQYYLWLKTLNNHQLLLEEQEQQSLIANQLNDNALSQGKLILIYSVPSPLLHKPYKAKRLLNEHLLASNKMSKDNLAFTMLLRDQLNAQLHLLKKNEQSEQGFKKKLDEQHVIIKQLNQKLNHVNQQLILLKKIDKNINERG